MGCKRGLYVFLLGVSFASIFSKSTRADILNFDNLCQTTDYYENDQMLNQGMVNMGFSPGDASFVTGSLMALTTYGIPAVGKHVQDQQYKFSTKRKTLQAVGTTICSAVLTGITKNAVVAGGITMFQLRVEGLGYGKVHNSNCKGWACDDPTAGYVVVANSPYYTQLYVNSVSGRFFFDTCYDPNGTVYILNNNNYSHYEYRPSSAQVKGAQPGTVPDSGVLYLGIGPHDGRYADMVGVIQKYGDGVYDSAPHCNAAYQAGWAL